MEYGEDEVEYVEQDVYAYETIDDVSVYLADRYAQQKGAHRNAGQRGADDVYQFAIVPAIHYISPVADCNDHTWPTSSWTRSSD